MTLRDYRPGVKKVVVLDEFQYLGKGNKAFPSMFQKIWDEMLKDAKIMVILCGSLISMMESQTLSHESPLYGRRTGQVRMQQLPFSCYREFYPEKSMDDLVQLYAVTGGVPKYIQMFQGVSDIYDAIRNNILSRQSYLYEEPIFLLEREVTETASYFTILKAIAHGHHKLGHMSASLGVSQTKLTQYLRTLMGLDLVERQVPVTEDSPEKSKRGLYYLKDNYIEFWFKFVYPFRSQIEMGDDASVIEKIQSTFLSSHVSFVFERVCLEQLWYLNKLGSLPFRFMKAGRWWNGREEIDIVALSRESREALFCECTYTDAPVGVDVFYALVGKSKSVEWGQPGRQEHFVLFSRSGFTEQLQSLARDRTDLMLVPLHDGWFRD